MNKRGRTPSDAPPVPIGPSAEADWTVWELPSSAGSGAVLTLPDEAAPVVYYLPDGPALADDPETGAPGLAATVLLDRQPHPEEAAIGHLVRHGAVSLDLTLASSPAVPEALAGETRAENDPSGGEPPVEYRPLYTREVQFDLIQDEKPLVSTTAYGTEPRVTVSGALNRDAILGFMAALRGEASDLVVRTTVSFRTAEAPRRVTVRGTWSDVHDALAARIADDPVGESVLREAFASMLKDGIVTAEPEGPTDALFAAFMRQASVILTEVDDDQYALRGRPHPSFGFTAVETVRTGRERSVTLETDLKRVVGSALDGYEWDRFVRLYPLQTDRPGEPVLRRTRSTSARPRGPGEQRPTRMAAIDGGVRSVASVIAVDESPAGLPRADWRPTVIDDARWQALDDLRVGEQVAGMRHLPVVDEGKEKESVWPDRIDANRYWYPPGFDPIKPDTTTDANEAFAFDCEVLGALPEGGRALRATVRIKLEPTPPDSRAVEELDDRHDFRPVELTDVSVELNVPYFDQDSRKTRRNALPGEASWDGEHLVVEVDLIDEWVKLAYGALSDPDFQELDATLTVAYAFEAYQPINNRTVILTVEDKVATLPVEYADRGVRRGDPLPVYFDAPSSTLHLPNRAVRLGPSQADAAEIRTEPTAVTADGGAAETRARSFPTMTASATPVTPLTDVGTLIRPEHTIGDVTGGGEITLPGGPGPKYGVRTMRRRGSVDLLYPCETYGDRYRRTVDGETEAIGCDDAFRLDEITFRPYRRLPEALTPAVREYVRDVYQSRQRPDRYLVVPERYRIDRRPPTDTRPYQLRAMLHSTVRTDETDSTCTFIVGLVPDLPPYARRALTATLADLGADDPILEYPTAAADTTEYEWLTGFDIEEGVDAAPTVFEADRALYVHLETGLINGHLLVNWLRSMGVRGRATFMLADGTTLPVDLELNLARPTGPLEAGPIAVTHDGGRVELSNPTRNLIDVTDLRIYGSDPDAMGPAIPVEATLDPGERVEVEVPSGFPEAYPIYTERASEATEIDEHHLFVENITANIVFHTSADLEALDIEELQIEVGLASGSEGARSVGLSPGTPTGEVRLVLPLTAYLDEAIVRYRIEATYTDDTTARTSWSEWDLTSRGPIVFLTEGDLP